MFDMAIAMKRDRLTDFHQDHVGSGITQDYVAEFGRSVIESVVHKLGRTLSLHVHSQAKAVETSLRLETFLVGLMSYSAGTFVRVAPELERDTYPSMLEFTRQVGNRWVPEGRNVVRVGAARIAFVTAEQTTWLGSSVVDIGPDCLFEVVGADRLSTDWFSNNIAPSTKAPGLTTVFIGIDDSKPSLFRDVIFSNKDEETRDGVQRHFSVHVSTPTDKSLLPLAV